MLPAPTAPAPAAAEAAPAPEAAPASQLTSWEAIRVLLRHCRRTPVAAFVAFMFFGQGATFLANFPFVVWLDEVRDFSVAEVGSITIVGAVGNAIGSYCFGLLFDRFAEKRWIHLACVLLSVVPYTFFIFIREKPLLFVNYFAISAGYGGLYAVQVSQMRLLADRTVAAAYAGLCMGSLSLAAAAGTVVGGAVGELVSYEAVYVRAGAPAEACGRAQRTLANRTPTRPAATPQPRPPPQNFSQLVGCGVGLGSACLIPWITSIDPSIVALKQQQREERRRRAGGKRLRRRSSFRDWLGVARGAAGRDLLLEEERRAEAASPAAEAQAGAATPAKTQTREQEAEAAAGRDLLLEEERRDEAAAPAAEVQAGAATPAKTQTWEQEAEAATRAEAEAAARAEEAAASANRKLQLLMGLFRGIGLF